MKRIQLTLVNRLLPAVLVLGLGPVAHAGVSDLTASGTVDPFTGAWTYNVDMFVPPGRAGVEPGLSLSYRSDAVQGFSWVGSGWSLDYGFVERRGPKGQIPGYDGSDEYWLNGQKLIHLGNNEYRTEYNTFERIRYTGSAWVVTSTTGVVHDYGNTPESRLAGSGGNTWRWYWRRTTDRSNNTMTAAYTIDTEGPLYLAKISYTGASGASELRSVEFNLSAPLGDNIGFTSYASGRRLKFNRRLDSIDVKYGATRVQRYVLTYDYQNDFSRMVLREVAVAVDPTKGPQPGYRFSYVEPATGNVWTTRNSTWALPAGVFLSDLDSKQGPRLANGQVVPGYLGGSEDPQGVRFGDLNADGFADIVTNTTTYLSNRAGGFNATASFVLPKAFTVNRSLGAQVPYVINSVLTLLASGSESNVPNGTVLADVNSDGRADILHANAITGQRQVYLNNGTSWVAAAAGTWVLPEDFVRGFTDYYGRTVQTGLRMAELNGDGYPDFIFAERGTRRTWVNNGAGWTETTKWLVPANTPTLDFVFDASTATGWSQSLPNKQNRFFNGVELVDINGDGLDDLLVNAQPYDGELADGRGGINNSVPIVHTVRGVWINQGSSGTFAPSTEFPPPPLPLGDFMAGQFLDLNNDGRPDFTYSYGFTDPSYDDPDYKLGMALVGRAFVRDARFAPPVPTYAAKWDSVTYGGGNGTAFVDINNDGWPDVVHARRNDTHQPPGVWLHASANRAVGAMSLVQMPLGGTVSVAYQHIKTFSLVPVTHYVATSVTIHAGGTAVPVSTTHRYSRAIFDPSRGGFVGFGEHRVTDATSVTRTVFYNTRDRSSRVQQVLVTDLSGNPLRQTVNRYAPDADGVAPFSSPQVVTLNSAKLAGNLDWRPIPAAGLASGRYQFLYRNAVSGDWYMSPPYTGAWSWSSFAPSTGVFTYGLGTSTSQVGISMCFGGQAGTYGVGCSSGTTGVRILPSGTPNPAASQGQICQDIPGFWGTGAAACQTADIYYADLNSSSTDGVSVSVETNFDAYGNVSSTKEFGLNTTSADDRLTVLTYSYNTTDWLVALPASVTVYKGTTATAANRMSASLFVYDNALNETVPPTKGLTTKVQGWLDTTNTFITLNTHSYTSYGLRESTWDALGRRSQFAVYDAVFNAFPVSLTNALGHTAQFSTDALTGQANWAKDPNGQTTTYGYDALYRPISLTTPNNGGCEAMRTDYYWDRSPPMIREFAGGSCTGMVSETIYDGLGRVIQTRSSHPDGKVVTTTEYDSRGVAFRTSAPFMSTRTDDGFYTGASFWNTTERDALGRVSRVIGVDGKFTSFFYGPNLDTTVQDPLANTKVSTVGADGQLLSVNEPNGTGQRMTTRYTYDVLGRRTQTVDAHGNTSTTTYDSLSRPKTIQDPDMGLATITEVDNAGNLRRLVNARNQPTRLFYDELHRVRHKDIGDNGTMDVTWTYDEVASTFPIGRKTSMSDAAGSARYNYDANGNLASMSRVLDGKTYTWSYGYDVLGRKTFETPPDGITNKFIYDRSGALSNAVGQAVLEHNARGQLTKLTYSGAPLVAQMDYYTNGRPRSRLATAGGTTLLAQVYTYDDVGNLKIVSDGTVGGQNLVLDYDSLYRLKQVTTNGVAQLFDYDLLGNLKKKDFLHQTYPTTAAVRPHAVSRTAFSAAGSLTPPAGVSADLARLYTYDASGNLVDSRPAACEGNTQCAAGGALASKVRTLAFNSDNMPTRITEGNVAVDYVYDGDGVRVKKISTVNGVATTTLYLNGFRVIK